VNVTPECELVEADEADSFSFDKDNWSLMEEYLAEEVNSALTGAARRAVLAVRVRREVKGHPPASLDPPRLSGSNHTRSHSIPIGAALGDEPSTVIATLPPPSRYSAHPLRPRLGEV
jgi:hypothetical protein